MFSLPFTALPNSISNIHTEQILHVIVYVHHCMHFLVERKVKGLNETLYDHRVNCQGRINSLILLLLWLDCLLPFC